MVILIPTSKNKQDTCTNMKQVSIVKAYFLIVDYNSQYVL